MKRRNIHVAGCLALLAIAGCNPRDAGNLTEDTKNLAQHSAQSLGSAKLAASVNTVLALRKGVDMSGLHVDAQDGVVTLGGTVRNEEERKRILQTVDGIRGVDKIVNKLHVQKP